MCVCVFFFWIFPTHETLTSSPREAKLADRIEGETMTEFLSQASTLALAETENAARALVAVRLAATALPARALRAKTAELAETADIVCFVVEVVQRILRRIVSETQGVQQEKRDCAARVDSAGEVE